MAIRHIRNLPNELPNALLYLDDIEEIQRILVDAYTVAEEAHRKQLEERYGSPYPGRKPEITVIYQVDDRQMDSITDLAEYGLSATNFRLTVDSDGMKQSVFKVRFGGEPILVPSFFLEEATQWSIYSKIKAILDRRQLRFKNAILNLPGWLRFPLFGMIAWLFPQLALVAHYPLRLFLYLAWLPFLAATMYVGLWPSRVYFVRSHEQSKVSASARQGYIKAVVLLAAGAIIGKLVELLFGYIKH